MENNSLDFWEDLITYKCMDGWLYRLWTRLLTWSSFMSRHRNHPTGPNTAFPGRPLWYRLSSFSQPWSSGHPVSPAADYLNQVCLANRKLEGQRWLENLQGEAFRTRIGNHTTRWLAVVPGAPICKGFSQKGLGTAGLSWVLQRHH